MINALAVVFFFNLCSLVFWAGTRCIDVYSLEKTNMVTWKPPKMGNGLWMFVVCSTKKAKDDATKTGETVTLWGVEFISGHCKDPSVNHLIESSNLFDAICLSNRNNPPEVEQQKAP